MGRDMKQKQFSFLCYTLVGKSFLPQYLTEKVKFVSFFQDFISLFLLLQNVTCCVYMLTFFFFHKRNTCFLATLAEFAISQSSYLFLSPQNIACCVYSLTFIFFINAIPVFLQHLLNSLFLSQALSFSLLKISLAVLTFIIFINAIPVFLQHLLNSLFLSQALFLSPRNIACCVDFYHFHKRKIVQSI